MGEFSFWYRIENTMSEIINSQQAPEPVGAYPHARRVGNLLFLSGVGPRKRNSTEIPGVTLDENRNIIAYDIEQQCHSVFKNVQLILEASGSQWENLGRARGQQESQSKSHCESPRNFL